MLALLLIPAVSAQLVIWLRRHRHLRRAACWRRLQKSMPLLPAKWL